MIKPSNHPFGGWSFCPLGMIKSKGKAQAGLLCLFSIPPHGVPSRSEAAKEFLQGRWPPPRNFPSLLKIDVETWPLQNQIFCILWSRMPAIWDCPCLIHATMSENSHILLRQCSWFSGIVWLNRLKEWKCCFLDSCSHYQLEDNGDCDYLDYWLTAGFEPQTFAGKSCIVTSTVAAFSPNK